MTTTVVTGVSVVAPNGLGTEAYWKATLDALSAIGPISRFDAGSYPSRLAGEVADFDGRRHLPSRLVPQTDRMTQFALAASDWAIEDAAVDTAAIDPLDMGVTTASASGGFDFGQRELEQLWSKGPQHVSAYLSFAWFYAVNSGQISIRNNLRGPTGVVVTEQAGGLDAIAQARRLVRGGTRLVVTGATDASLCPYGWAAQISGGSLSTRTDPERAYLPFDRDAAGHVPGEGGAMLVVEGAGHARARGVTPYGEIAGYGASFDPPPGSGRPGNLGRAIVTALADAGMTPDDIGVVFADAAGQPEADREEASALTGIFGPYGVPVTVPKTMTGRLYAGAAPVDVVAALLALRDGVIPPTAHVTCGYDIDLVQGAPRAFAGRAALVVARGRGGANSALIVRTAGK
ncbi:ketosynthase chain-length factor [Streptomyces cyaneofuscatus]|uniref:ketosynthase chain-length factor n=1 Tax=Streptomyces cyaneofuscatus TaxID=66883 RepID=UPI0033BD4667